MIIIILSTIGIMVYRIAITIFLMTKLNDKTFIKKIPAIASITGAFFTALLIVVTLKVRLIK